MMKISRMKTDHHYTRILIAKNSQTVGTKHTIFHFASTKPHTNKTLQPNKGIEVIQKKSSERLKRNGSIQAHIFIF